MSSPSIPLNSLMQYRIIMNQLQSSTLQNSTIPINIHTISLPMMSSQESRSNATSKEFIDSLQEITITNEKETCSICLEDFTKGDIAIQLPCKGKPHFFHKQSETNTCCGVIPWLVKHNSCPVCRMEFPSEPIPTQEVNYDTLPENEHQSQEEIIDMIVSGIQEMIDPIEQDLEDREEQDLQNALMASLQD
jgi:hypothetical protein